MYVLLDLLYHELQVNCQASLLCEVILTVLLVGLAVVAWKAPAWVKKIGITALVVGVMFALIDFRSFCDTFQREGSDMTTVDITKSLVPVVCSLHYGMFIFFVSLIIRITRKPRI